MMLFSPPRMPCEMVGARTVMPRTTPLYSRDRKSTRLNSSHLVISYAVFCLKKKKKYISDPSRWANAQRLSVDVRVVSAGDSHGSRLRSVVAGRVRSYLDPGTVDGMSREQT